MKLLSFIVEMNGVPVFSYVDSCNWGHRSHVSLVRLNWNE